MKSQVLSNFFEQIQAAAQKRGLTAGSTGAKGASRGVVPVPAPTVYVFTPSKSAKISSMMCSCAT